MNKTTTTIVGLLALGMAGCASKKRGPYGDPPVLPHGATLAQTAPDQQGTGQTNPGTGAPGTGQSGNTGGASPGTAAPDAQIATPTPAPFVTATPAGGEPVDQQTGVMAGTSAGLPSSTTSTPAPLPTATPAR